MLVVSLAPATFVATAFARLRTAFTASNPGYDVTFAPRAESLVPGAQDRVIFVQAGEAAADDGPVTTGDVILLRAGQSLALQGAASLVAFSLPEPLPAGLPAILRPDRDAAFADQPGGCATGDGAYRRVLLTWRPDHGEHVCHQINVHRVRMDDSFSHYHPHVGGFDELYLVQGTGPDAAVVHSDQVPRIVAPDDVARAEAATLLTRRPVAVDELVFIPRGEMHRGVGGVLAQVITVPGFVPGAEIGVDHHLRAINVRLGLTGATALPVHGAPP